MLARPGAITAGSQCNIIKVMKSMRAFISYSVSEKQFGGAVKKALENLGVECFLAHEDLQVTDVWKTRIIEQLRIADIFIAVLSAKYKASEWCDQELGFIVSRPEAEVVIVPLSIDNTIPYGFISHIQGQHVSDESAVPGIIEDLLYRNRPRDMIPIQIERVRQLIGNAEVNVRPLVPHFKKFTEQEAADFASAVIGHYGVLNDRLCCSEYLPKFLAANGKRISDKLKKELEEKIEHHRRFPELLMPGLLEEEKKRVNRPVPKLPIAEDTDPLKHEFDREAAKQPFRTTPATGQNSGDSRTAARVFVPRRLK